MLTSTDKVKLTQDDFGNGLHSGHDGFLFDNLDGLLALDNCVGNNFGGLLFFGDHGQGRADGTFDDFRRGNKKRKKKKN